MSLAATPRNSLEIPRAHMAKANLKNLEVATDWRRSVGKAIQRCLSIAGLTQDEASGLLQRDAAQLSRWIAGTERPQFDVILGQEQLRGPLVIALAELAVVDVEVVTEIRVRRRA